MNIELKARLKQWYSDAQIVAFFGARSDSELAQIVTAMQDMTDQQVAKFRKQLGATYRKQLAARPPKRRRSAFGVMLVRLHNDDKL